MPDTEPTRNTQKNNSPGPVKPPPDNKSDDQPQSANWPVVRPVEQSDTNINLPHYDPDRVVPPPFIDEKISEESTSIVKESEMDLVSLKGELVKSLKELTFLLYQARTNQQKEIESHLKAAYTACRMLGRVLRNRPFRNSIKHLAEIREQNAVEFVKSTMINELTNFIKKEAELLNYYGLPNADMYVNEGLSTLGRIVDGEVSYTNVLKTIDDLRIEACNLHRDLENQTPSAMNFERTKQIIVKLSMGIGAVIIVIINVQAEAEGKLTPIQATLSGHIASGIIGAAVADIWSLVSSV